WPLSILSAVSSLINLALPIAMSRLLPAEEIGQFKIFFLYLMSAPGLAMSVGISNGIFYWSAQKDKGPDLLKNAWSLLLVLSIAFPVVCLLFYPFFPAAHGWTWEHKGLFLWATVPTILSLYYEYCCVATGRVWRGAAFGA